jgi:hypothetical protein
VYSLTCCRLYNSKYVYTRISIPAYAIEQQWGQSGVPKNEMSLTFKNNARSFVTRVTMWLSFKNYWHANKWSSISFSHWQCPSDGDFSYPRFVGLLILSLCFIQMKVDTRDKSSWSLDAKVNKTELQIRATSAEMTGNFDVVYF